MWETTKMAINESKKNRAIFLLKHETIEKLEEVSNKLGITKSGIIELVIEKLF